MTTLIVLQHGALSCLKCSSISPSISCHDALASLSSKFRKYPTLSPKRTQIFRARGVSPSQVDAVSSPKKEIVSDSEFSIDKLSFAVVGLSVGCTLLVYGFGAYFNLLPGSEWSALMLTYGFPVAVIGMALKYAELKPAPCITYSDALSVRESRGTPVLNQVRRDVTRFRYGDEQHLDEALKRIFRYGKAGGVQRRNAPILKMIREEITEEGKYSLVLVFEAKSLKFSDFEERQEKFASFFGPGVTAKIGRGGPNMYEVALISENSGQPSTT